MIWSAKMAFTYDLDQNWSVLDYTTIFFPFSCADEEEEAEEEGRGREQKLNMISYGRRVPLWDGERYGESDKEWATGHYLEIKDDTLGFLLGWALGIGMAGIGKTVARLSLLRRR